MERLLLGIHHSLFGSTNTMVKLYIMFHLNVAINSVRYMMQTGK